jgi:exosome complex RNA-binding protein Rrp42 (RNase PH superfamily)
LLECCGNLCDACALAAKFALAKAKFPKLFARSDDEGQIEIDVADDPLAIKTVNVDNVPYSISVNKIGHNYVVDADLKEEAVTKVRIIFGIDQNGHIRYSNKDGFGSLDPDTLYAMVDVSLLFHLFTEIVKLIFLINDILTRACATFYLINFFIVFYLSNYLSTSKTNLKKMRILKIIFFISK